MSSARKSARGGDKKLYLSLIIDIAIKDMTFNLMMRGLIKVGEAKEVTYYVYKIV